VPAPCDPRAAPGAPPGPKAARYHPKRTAGSESRSVSSPIGTSQLTAPICANEAA
jgi:hypothetical protein